jgi:transcriptional regulator with XRE-family HTH domain
MNDAAKITGSARRRVEKRGGVAVIDPGCEHRYPGTREELILVSQALPNTGEDALRRRELADFLRTRRAALRPQDVGLDGGGRRRTPGLRREEVALLAGVGSTWYTWLEQARDVRASRAVLEAIGEALRLTEAERAHLVRLGRGEERETRGPAGEEVSGTLRRLIAHLGPNPAYLLGRRWDFLAWNDATAALFGDPGELPPQERNHVWLTFTDPLRRELVTDWEDTARVICARFRADAARQVGDPAFEALVARLKEASPEFRRLWRRHEVVGDVSGRKELEHPTAGRMVFEHMSFRPTQMPAGRLVLYSPLPELDTPAKMEVLMAARAAGRRLRPAGG